MYALIIVHDGDPCLDCISPNWNSVLSSMKQEATFWKSKGYEVMVDIGSDTDPNQMNEYGMKRKLTLTHDKLKDAIILSIWNRDPLL